MHTLCWLQKQRNNCNIPSNGASTTYTFAFYHYCCCCVCWVPSPQLYFDIQLSIFQTAHLRRWNFCRNIFMCVALCFVGVSLLLWSWEKEKKFNLKYAFYLKTHRFDFRFCCVCNQFFFNRKSIKLWRANKTKLMVLTVEKVNKY